MNADIAAVLLQLRAAASRRGDVALVAEIDHTYPRLLEESHGAPETTQAPALENTAQPRPARRRR